MADQENRFAPVPAAANPVRLSGGYAQSIPHEWHGSLEFPFRLKAFCPHLHRSRAAAIQCARQERARLDRGLPESDGWVHSVLR